MLLKFLHTADIHLDSPLRSLALRDERLRERVQVATRDAFSRLVDYALAEKVSGFLICGDLFDGSARSAKTGAFLIAQMEKLRSAGILVFYIKGNHDAENPLSGEIDLPDNVHMFDGRGSKVQVMDSDVWIHGVSFNARHAPDSLLNKFPAPVPNAVNIAMLHTSLAGTSNHDLYAPCTVVELQSMGFDYWALGHVHKREVHCKDPWIVMPGIPQGRDIGESGSKSATLLTIEDGQIATSEIQSTDLEFQEHTIDISACSSDDQLRSILRERVEEIAKLVAPSIAVVRLTLSGQYARRWQMIRDTDLWIELIHNLANDTQMLWIEKVRFDLAATTGAAPDASASSELQMLMKEISQEDAFSAAAIADISKVLEQLTASQRRQLIPDESSLQDLYQSLSASGVEYMVALMKGAAK